MLPLTMTLRVDTDRGHRVRLWLPLFLIWLVALPLLILLLPFYLAFCAVMRLNPVRLVAAFWGADQRDCRNPYRNRHAAHGRVPAYPLGENDEREPQTDFADAVRRQDLSR